MGGIDMEIRHRRYKIAVNALRALIVFVGFALIPSVFGGYEFGYYETGSFFIRLAADVTLFFGLLKLERKCTYVYDFTSHFIEEESIHSKKEGS